MPTYLIVSIVIVLTTAVGFVAARSGAGELTTGAGDVEATPLPTPVPLETGTPLPTPAPMTQGAIVDTAVTFWGAWLPEEVTDALNAIAAGRSRTAGSGSAGDAEEPRDESATPTPTLAPVTTPPPNPLAAPTAVPLPPLPAPIPSVPVVPLPTLPPLLP
ncbi:MAG: hypothetical protein ACXWWO_05925 [Candidatus Limnocylindria bacterium]